MHRRGDVLHRVVDCQTGRDRSARRVDIQFDGFAGIFRLEKEQLRREERRGLVVDLGLVWRSADREARRSDRDSSSSRSFSSNADIVPDEWDVGA